MSTKRARKFSGLKVINQDVADTHPGAERFRNMPTLLMIAFAEIFIKGLLKIQTPPFH